MLDAHATETGYPKDVTLDDGRRLVATPLVPSDWEMMWTFLEDIPLDDRLFVRSDLDSREVVEKWCRNLDYQRVQPILVWDGGRIAADGVLHLEPGLWTAHLGRLRLIVHPDYRGMGVGRWLVAHLMATARQLRLHKVVSECAADQTPLLTLLTRLGFYQAARLHGFIRDRGGRRQDMVLMVADVRLEHRDHDGSKATVSELHDAPPT